MVSIRLTSEMWVSALKKRLDLHAIPFFLVKKGDKQAGAILIRVSDLCGMSKIFEHVSRVDGERQWVEIANGFDAEIEEVLRKQRAFDNDVWILEVEEFKGVNFFEDFLNII